MRQILYFSIALLLIIEPIQPALAKEKIYQTGKLIDIRIDSQKQTEYVASTSTNLQNRNTTYANNHSNSFGQTQKIASNFGSASLNSFNRFTPVTTVTNTYYFLVKLNNLIYVSSFSPAWRKTIDTNWVIGDPIQVRLNNEANRLYIQKPSGKELKTKIFRIEKA